MTNKNYTSYTLYMHINPYRNIYSQVFCCVFLYFSWLAYIFMHNLPLTGETFGKIWCSPSFRSSEYMSIIVHCFPSETKEGSASQYSSVFLGLVTRFPVF